MTHRSLEFALLLSLTLQLILPPWAIAGFTVSGKKVSSVETNFAGERQVSPKFKIAVQVNHDAEQTRDLELTIIDEVFQSLLADHRRESLIPSNFLPVVFITDVKMRRFHEGPRRWIFRLLEGEKGKHPDVYLSPTAVFISDSTLGDDRRLRAALYQGLSYVFSQEFYEAMQGLIERGVPVPYPHD